MGLGIAQPPVIGPPQPQPELELDPESGEKHREEEEMRRQVRRRMGLVRGRGKNRCCTALDNWDERSGWMGY